MQIFLSYASEDREIADQVHLALSAGGHKVFFDRDTLPPGGDYHSRIRNAVADSDLFVFLISPNSVSPGSYALTELKFARDKWAHPKNRVLPVLLEQMDFKLIPAYLKAVTVLEPEGSVSAETLDALSEMAQNVNEGALSTQTGDMSTSNLAPDIKSARTHKVTVPVLVAVIGMVGVLGTAVITNWDKLFAFRSDVAGENTSAASDATGSGAPSEDVPLTTQSLLESLKKSVISVRTQGMNESNSSWQLRSSSFFVSEDGMFLLPTYAVSTDEVFSTPSDKLKVEVGMPTETGDMDWLPASLITVNKELKLALLQLTFPDDVFPIPFSERTVRLGDEVSLFGISGGGVSNFEGHIIQRDGLVVRVEATRLIVSIPALTSALAGGPVTDEYGSVVGIVIGGNLRTYDSIVVPIRLAAGFLNPYL